MARSHLPTWAVKRSSFVKQSWLFFFVNSWNGGFLKWGYPSSSFFNGWFYIRNHLFWATPIYENPHIVCMSGAVFLCFEIMFRWCRCRRFSGGIVDLIWDHSVLEEWCVQRGTIVEWHLLFSDNLVGFKCLVFQQYFWWLVGITRIFCGMVCYML